MEFFNSLTLDLKMLVVGIAGFALLAVFSGNRKSEKRYMLVLTVLAAVGVWRFMHVPSPEPADRSDGTQFVKVTPKSTPIVSTSAK
jgi:hypothetical protein